MRKRSSVMTGTMAYEKFLFKYDIAENNFFQCGSLL